MPEGEFSESISSPTRSAKSSLKPEITRIMRNNSKSPPIPKLKKKSCLVISLESSI